MHKGDNHNPRTHPQTVNTPGLIVRPMGDFRTREDFHYQTMRCNVELAKVIQIGVTVSDSESLGQGGVPFWRFNFHFDCTVDALPEEMEQLLRSARVNFDYLRKNGIDSAVFAEWMFSSGLVLNDRLRWVGFNCLADFGFLLRLVTSAPLPATEDAFVALLRLYFPHVYDTRLLVQLSPHKAELQADTDVLQNVRRGLLLQQVELTTLSTLILFVRARRDMDAALGSNVLYGLTDSTRLLSHH